MMAVTYSYVSLILCLLTGGGNDLLDYALTDAYWREKNVEVTYEVIVAQLESKPAADVSKLIPDLGSPDAETRDKATLQVREAGGAAMKALAEASESPDAELRRRARLLLRQIGGDEIERGVRRLMAIRTLGEMQKPEALPILKPLLTSKELFVADYAQVAIDQIEGRKPGTTARPVGPGVAEDVWLLPADCRTVGQLVPRRGTPLGTAEFMASFKQDAGTIKRDEDRDERAAQVTRMVLSLADQIGNVRIDAATFGVSGPIVPTGGPDAGDPGYVTLIVRGHYHAEWARTLAKSERIPSQQIDGVEVFQPDGEKAWMMPADDLFVFVASPSNIESALQSVVKSIKSGKPADGARAEATQKLLQTIDTNQVLWAAAAVTPEQKKLPVVEAFDTITLRGVREGKTLTLTMNARGTDAAEVEKAAKKIDKHAKDSVEFLHMINGVPLIDLSVELLRSVQVKSEGNAVTLTAKIDATPAAILSFPDLQDEAPEKSEAPPAHPRLQQESK